MSAPPWLPNWEKADSYPPKGAALDQWVWEFLRRSPLYQSAWQEQLAPKQGIDEDDDPDGVDLHVFRTQFGIIGVPPNPADHADAVKGVFWLETQSTSAISPSALKTEPTPKHEYGIVFDLRWPVERQLEAAKKRLRSRQKMLVRKHGLTVIDKRNGVQHFQTYLRVLDAEAVGAIASNSASRTFYTPKIAAIMATS